MDEKDQMLLEQERELKLVKQQLATTRRKLDSSTILQDSFRKEVTDALWGENKGNGKLRDEIVAKIKELQTFEQLRYMIENKITKIEIKG